jgi:predicted nuclease of restriction endonuclease-like (RecB) superfamily
MTTRKLPSNYPTFLAEVKQRIRTSQYAALKSVNTELIKLYWELGRMIAERQEQQGWGSSVVDKLSEDLQTEFPGQAGFSRRNIYRIRDLYLSYKDDTIVPPLVAQIGWSHNVMILDKCKTPEERRFYIAMTKKFGWTKNILAAQISSNAFASAASAQSNFGKVLPPERAAQAQLAIKDEYTFDFLDLAQEHSERELERALLAKVNRFLIEMGGMFTFVGSQHRIRVDDQDFFVDLLLYHRSLRCFVAVELKITEFKPAYAGQMQFYLTALNKTQRLPDEEPAIGIILCREKNRTVVEYALADSKHPLGIASYSISERLPRTLQKQLPTTEQMSVLLDTLFDEYEPSIDSDRVAGKATNLSIVLDGSGFVPPMAAQLRSRNKKKKKKSAPTSRKGKK